jgi:hypothetical protein
MVDFKCVACRTRIRHVGDAADFTGDPCPSCGSPYELVSELSEVVGCRSVTTGDRPVDNPAPLLDFTEHRNVIYAQRVRDALDDERWIDDGGAAVVAVALPTAAPRVRPNAGALGENGAT